MESGFGEYYSMELLGAVRTMVTLRGRSEMWMTIESSEGYAMTADIRERQPTHPGIALEQLLMKQLGLDSLTLHEKTGLPVDVIDAVCAGERAIDREIAYFLKEALGNVAEDLYRMQLSFDFFSAHGVRPPHNQLMAATL